MCYKNVRWRPLFLQIDPQNGTEFAQNQGEHLANPVGKRQTQNTSLPRGAWWKAVKSGTSTPISEPSLFGAGWPTGGFGGKKTTKTPNTQMLII